MIKRSRVFRIFYLIVLITFLISGILLAVRLFRLHQGNEFYQRIRKAGSTVPASSSGSFPASAPIARPGLPQLYDLETSFPGTFPLSPDISRLSKQYPDLAAWLQIPGTSIDYPVLLGTDNQFYLNHLPDGSENPLGSLFFDCRSRPDSSHFIIYGHNGAGGAMFGLLKQYESPDYYKTHPALTITTPDSCQVCPIFSVRRVAAGSDAYTLEFENPDAYKDYLEKAAAASLYPIDADCTFAVKILTLSTCTSQRNQRLIVQAFVQ